MFVIDFMYKLEKHSESADLRQGHRSLPKFNGLLLVPSSIFPENFIKIHS